MLFISDWPCPEHQKRPAITGLVSIQLRAVRPRNALVNIRPPSEIRITWLKLQRVGLQAVFNRAKAVKFKADSPRVVVTNVILKNNLQLINIVEFTGVEAF